MATRRAGGLLAVALVLASAGANAQRSGLRGQAEATTLTEVFAQLFQAIGSETLRPFIPRMERLRDQADAGRFDAGVADASALVGELRGLRVTEAEQPARLVLLTLATGLLGDLQGLSGRVAEGQRTWRSIQDLPADEKLKAMALVGEANLSLLDLQFATAGGLEKRAERLMPDDIVPILPGVERLWALDPARALVGLEPAVIRGISRDYALLYAAAAALAMGRQGQAAQYLDQCQASLSYHPHFPLFSGLLAASAGDLPEALRRFADGEQRDQGRLRMNGLLHGVAEIAGGQTQAGAARISRYLGAVPANFRRVAEAILLSPDLAGRALRQPGVWFTPFSAAALAGAPGGPFDLGAPLVDGSEVQVGEGTGGGGGGGSPNPAGGGAGGSGGGTAPVVRPGDTTGLSVLARETQAAEAYQTALKLTDEGRPLDAERALETAVGLRADFPEAWSALGRLRFERGDDRAAATAFGLAARQRPSWPEPAYGLALCADRLGDSATARLGFRTALDRGLAGALADYAKQRLATLGG